MSQTKQLKKIMGKIKNPTILIVIALAAIVLYIFQLYSNSKNLPEISDGELRVHFIDCGQGDCALVTLPSGENIMIDSGTSDSKYYVSEYLTSVGIQKIDTIILSHPHSDHIGGASEIIESFSPSEIIMPDAISDTPIFEKLLSKIEKKSISLKTAKAGDIFNYRDVNIRILSPMAEYEDLNNMSIILRLEYGRNSFLFTGDAEKDAENDVLDSIYSSYLKADVLKTAHHGSSTSTTNKFLSEINPSYAVISCGENNDYGHPHRETVNKFKKLGIPVYRTDLDGNIVFSSNGRDISVLSPDLKK